MQAFLLLLYPSIFFPFQAGDWLSVSCQSVYWYLLLASGHEVSATPAHPSLHVNSQQERFIPLFAPSQSSQSFFWFPPVLSQSLSFSCSFSHSSIISVDFHLSMSKLTHSHILCLRQWQPLITREPKRYKCLSHRIDSSSRLTLCLTCMFDPHDGYLHSRHGACCLYVRSFKTFLILVWSNHCRERQTFTFYFKC